DENQDADGFHGFASFAKGEIYLALAHLLRSPKEWRTRRANARREDGGGFSAGSSESRRVSRGCLYFPRGAGGGSFGRRPFAAAPTHGRRRPGPTGTRRPQSGPASCACAACGSAEGITTSSGSFESSRGASATRSWSSPPAASTSCGSTSTDSPSG